jgi:hypothetical protein
MQQKGSVDLKGVLGIVKRGVSFPDDDDGGGGGGGGGGEGGGGRDGMGGDDGEGVGWGDGADGWEFVLKTKERNWVLKARTALERDRWVDVLVQLSPAVSGYTEDYTRGGGGSSRNLLRGGGDGAGDGGMGGMGGAKGTKGGGGSVKRSSGKRQPSVSMRLSRMASSVFKGPLKGGGSQ